MNTQATMNLKDMALVIPTIKVWTGGVAFDRDRDCPQSKNIMPSKELVQDGLLMLIKKSVLNPFLALRKRIDRLANDVGYRVSDRGGFAMTEGKAVALLPDFHAVYAQWQDELRNLMDNLPQLYAEREAEEPTWAKLLREGRLDAGALPARFKFNISFMPNGQMQMLDQALQQGVGDPLAEDHAMMLLESIATDARDALRGAINSKAQVTQTSLNQVRVLMAKLHEYVFLDPLVEAVYDIWSPIMDAMPRSGVTTEQETFMLKTMLETLKDPAVAIEYARKQMTAPDAADAAFILQNTAMIDALPQQSMQFAMAGAA